MLVSPSRKRRRKPCWPILALLSCSVARGKEQQQAFETVQVGRYTSAGARAVSHGGSSLASNATISNGRYGHAAIYQQYHNSILFIGGQIGTSGTYVTNDVLSLDLNKPYSRFSTISGFTETTNPALIPALSSGLPPNAWSAYAIDAQERIWLIGGVTQDCESDAVAYVLQDGSSWTPVDLGHYRPPRRRQASAIAVSNGTEDSSLYIFGGVAEPYTCSLETVGYLAMDIWNTTTTTAATPLVNSIPWETPSNTSLRLERQNSNRYEPAISDYAVVSLPEEKVIVYVGGQDANGNLASMDEVLLFNTSTSTWTTETITGEVPPPSMGQSATLLDGSRIVMFGGVGKDGVSSSNLRVLSRTIDGDWHWTSPDLSTSEITSPNRAWHTATLAENGVLVIAFGLDGLTGETADDVFFLKTTDSSSGWQWSRSNPSAMNTPPPATSPEEPSSAVYTPNSHVLVNVAADGDSDAITPAALDPSVALNAMAAAQTPLALTRPERPDLVTASDDLYETDVTSEISSTHSTRSPSRTPQSPASSAPPSSEEVPATTTKTSVIAGSVTAAFVAALLAGAAALYVRRRASTQTGEQSRGEKDEIDSSNVPPVSQLLYTRAAPKRMLSLGSAFSVRTVRNIHDVQDGLTFERVTGREASDALDFDNHVDEFGRLSPSSDSATVLGPTAHAMTHASSSDSSETRASVASYPFLTSVPRNDELSSQNSHEGHDLGLMNMLRSRSGESLDSGRSLTPQLQPQFTRWTSSIDFVEDSEEMQHARPSIDVTQNNVPNPFDDFHEVLPDTPSHTSSRQRDLSFLPPSLRPGAQ